MARATIVEEHASVLAHWWAQGVRNATLLTLDAHLDLQFIDPSRLARLQACTTAADLQALEASHPLQPDRSACFGIEDFLLPAVHLGVLRRVVWVAPPHVLEAGLAGALAGLQQMEGVTLAQLESFGRVPGGWIEGSLLGVPLAIGTLQQLARMPLSGPLVVDVDADYFVVVPGDALWAEPSDVAASLKAWVGPEHDLTIARSVGTGFLPLQLRWIADVLAACWEGRAPPTKKEPAQEDSLLRRLGEVRARALGLDLRGLLVLEREAHALHAAGRCPAAAWVALGLLHARFDRLDAAIACDALAHSGGAGHPELALEIARLLLSAQRLDEARPWLERAAEDDETRVQAWLHLADVAVRQGAVHEAWRAAQRAHAAAPAWPLPLQRMAVAAQALGEAGAAHRARTEHGALVQRLQQLARRLGG